MNLSAGCDVPSGELEDVSESGLKFRAIFCAQAADPRRVLIARREVLDLPLSSENAVGDNAGDISETEIAKDTIVLNLPLSGAPAHASALVIQGTIQIRAA